MRAVAVSANRMMPNRYYLIYQRSVVIGFGFR